MVLKPERIGQSYFTASIDILNQVLRRIDIRMLKDIRLVLSGSDTYCESLAAQMQQQDVIEQITVLQTMVTAFSLAVTFVLPTSPPNRLARLDQLLRSSFSRLFQGCPNTLISPPGTSSTYRSTVVGLSLFAKMG